mmetsp:Transcript_36874/g.71462  ORF Transcript_36874/g.71462 Transcript_36874/m.71462 type:complete len:98 (-) Transcript_36874:85-378(-)
MHRHSSSMHEYNLNYDYAGAEPLRDFVRAAAREHVRVEKALAEVAVRLVDHLRGQVRPAIVFAQRALEELGERVARVQGHQMILAAAESQRTTRVIA